MRTRRPAPPPRPAPAQTRPARQGHAAGPCRAGGREPGGATGRGPLAGPGGPDAPPPRGRGPRAGTGGPGSSVGPGAPPPRGRGPRTSTGGSGESWGSGCPAASWSATPNLHRGIRGVLGVPGGPCCFLPGGDPAAEPEFTAGRPSIGNPGWGVGSGHPVCPRAWISRWPGGGGAEPSPCSCFSSGTSNRNLWGPGSP